MKRRVGLFLLLSGAFVASRTTVALAVRGARPATATLALHAVAVPLVQVAVLEAVTRLRAARRRAA